MEFMSKSDFHTITKLGESFSIFCFKIVLVS